MATYTELLNNNNAMTITIASLTNNSARESTVVDNTSNQDFDAAVMVKIKSGAASTSATGYVNVYVYASADGGTTYNDNATGSDAAITLVVPPNARLIGVVNIVANATTYKAGPFSVASVLGYLPGKWGVIIENKTGGTLDATGGSHSVIYERVRGSSS